MTDELEFPEAQINQAVDAIMQADGLIIGAGAGMGVDSGLPDFRGEEGFWRAYPALAEAGMDFMEIANPAAFSMSPRLAWGFYGHRLNLYRSTRPHEGFAILRRIGEAMSGGLGVFTSNVDGHFEKAGFNQRYIYECHGSIHYLQCSKPCNNHIWSADSLTIQTDDDQCLAIGKLPKCPECGAMARPNILMFGDLEWCSQRSAVQRHKLQKILAQMASPVVIELGAGTAVPSVRRFCEGVDGTLVRINPRESRLPRKGGIAIAAGALASLQAIEKGLRSKGFF